MTTTSSVSEPRFVVFAIVSSFVLAELGDKTMLATVTLASDHNWAGVWIGATVGMVLADGVAIAAGALLHKRLPAGFLHSLASVLFLVFGLWLLFDSALGLRWVAVGVTGSVLVGVGIVVLVRFVRRRNAAPTTPASINSRSAPSRNLPAIDDGRDVPHREAVSLTPAP